MKFKICKPLKLDIMKKMIFSCILLFVVGCIMFSCKGGGLNPDPPIAKKFMIVATVDGIGGKVIAPSDVAIGEKVEITVEPDFGYAPKAISINNGSLLPLKTKNYLVTSSASSNLSIKVVFEKTTSWIFIQNSWIKDSVYIYEPKTPQDQTLVWKYYAIPTAEADVVTFLSNGRYSVIVGGAKGDGPWSVDETTNPPTLIWGQGWKIENISSESFRIYKDNFKDVYKRVK
jgi:hypothetical protein